MDGFDNGREGLMNREVTPTCGRGHQHSDCRFFQSSGIDTGMKSEHELVPPYSLEGLLFRYNNKTFFFWWDCRTLLYFIAGLSLMSSFFLFSIHGSDLLKRADEILLWVVGSRKVEY